MILLREININDQTRKLKFRLRGLTSCSFSIFAVASYFEGRVAGLDATVTGNELSQPKFEFSSFFMTHLIMFRCRPARQRH